jgi:tRNA nucleotidyltransferase/poly(A) polymerase
VARAPGEFGLRRRGQIQSSSSRNFAESPETRDTSGADDVYCTYMKLVSANIQPILRAIQAAGGRPLIVGGAVRDWLRGEDVKDFDVEVYGMSIDRLAELLAGFGRVDAVGRSFGILKLRLSGGHELDVSLPRRESKVGAGHRGFIAAPDPTMTPREAAARRDFTWNALAVTPEGELLDFFGGVADLEAGVIRHTTAAFAEDPLRVLRAMQFAARFGMRLAPETAALGRALLPEAPALARERIWAEWYKWALQGRIPSAGLRALAETGWLGLYPELEALIGCPQDSVWHPEGWSFSDLTSQARDTRPTQPFGIEDWLRLRKFSTDTATTAAMIPGFHGASSAEAHGITASSRLSSTNMAGALSSLLPPELSPAIYAEAEGFVWSFGSPAVNANEIVRIVFKIPLRRMKSIMLTSDDNFEVVRQVVHSVAIYVMHMLPSFQGTAELQFHHDSMNSDGTVFTRPGSVYVPIVIVDARTTPIDGNVFFYFDLAVVGNSNIAHVFDYNTRLRVLQVEVGDVWIHTLHVVDAAAAIAAREALAGDERAVLLFAALCHDLGKPATTEVGADGRIRSLGHAEAGVAPTEAFLRRIGCPRALAAQVLPLVREHMAHAGAQPTARMARRLALRLAPATIAQWGRLVEADHSGRPPLPPATPGAPFVALAAELDVMHGRPAPILQGRDLIEVGWQPGPALGAALRRAYAAQIDDEFATVEEGLDWVARHLAPAS